jgi:hypothetical protein
MSLKSEANEPPQHPRTSSRSSFQPTQMGSLSRAQRLNPVPATSYDCPKGRPEAGARLHRRVRLGGNHPYFGVAERATEANGKKENLRG